MNLVDRTENFKNMSLVIEGFKIRNLIDKGYLTEYRIKNFHAAMVS